MTKDIANIFKEALMPLKIQGIISNLEGLVRTLEFKPANSDKKLKIAYPVECEDVQDCVDCQSVYLCVPEKEKSCLVYFEGTQARVLNSAEGITTYEAIISLVCWYNLDKFEKKPFLQSSFIGLMSEPIKKLNIDNSEDVPIDLHLPTISSVIDSDSSIFAKYSYNESDSGFLGCKYATFKIDFKVKFSLYENGNCFNSILVSSDVSACDNC